MRKTRSDIRPTLLRLVQPGTHARRDRAVAEIPEVEEMLKCFDADWAQKSFDPDPKSRLIWCPSNGRERIAAFIDSAKE
ncbi:MAG TPA: hypothetical protein VML91_00500, partial [Burkholderiales bacterium]|nr:hypothetical protein [Burkholderiales bacterium]